MDAPLDAVAVRVLGSLIEKEITTPDYYPLTLNALVAACNQSSNRDPVLELDEDTVRRSLNDLRQRSIARGVQRMDSRVMRYSHLLTQALSLEPPELAAMCVLMLRGPQTAGEIKTHARRLFDFAEVAHVEHTLDGLAARPSPLVAQLPRGPGQKEARYAHLLSGEVATESAGAAPRRSSAASSASGAAASPVEARVAALEHDVGALRAELAELRARFEAFRREFQ
ncbi:MAG TPA: YceH family protein [Gemmatimonadaceae bacterium]|nr:YceH family protein [Gemmatimonadaceae bacterium]